MSSEAGPIHARLQRARDWLLLGGGLMAVAAPFTWLVGAVGSRSGAFSLHLGFDGMAMRSAPALALVAVALGLASAVAARTAAPRRRLLPAMAVIATGALAFGAITGWRAQAYRAPPVHDVSTDWTHTMLFSPALMAARGPDANPVETNPVVPATRAAGAARGQYVGVVNARTCPGATPAVLAVPPARAYDRVKAAAVSDRLALVTDDPAHGVLEATATSAWFGFKDDIAIQVRAMGAGARIDMRASARLGQSDFGRNCRLVTSLQRALRR